MNYFKKTTDWILFLLFKSILSFLGILPLTLARLSGMALGILAYCLDYHHRRVAMTNLSKAYQGEKGPRELRKIVRGVFMNLGLALAEFAWLPRINIYNLEKYITLEGEENYQRARSMGRGVVLLSAHLGNWEWLLTHRIKYNKGETIAKRIHNKWIDSLVQGYRSDKGTEIIPTRKSGKRVMELLESREEVAILLDQNALRDEGVFVDFFGQKACTHYGPAMLALRLNCPVLPFFIVREGIAKKLKLIYLEPIQAEASGDLNKDILNNTQTFTKTIEDMIRKYPEQWLWVHRRWKTRPEVED